MSDAARQGEVQSPPAPPDRQTKARRAGALMLLVYVVLFVVLNTHRVAISFVFFTIHTMTLFALAIVAVLSFVAGYLVHGRRAKRR